MTRILKSTWFGLVIGLVWPLLAQAHVTNVIGNSGFEQTFGGSGNWDNTANRGISNPAVAGAPEGSRVLRLDESTTVAGGFVGVFTFQTVSPAKEGDIVAFNGLVRANALDGGDAGQLRIEFQNSAGATLSDSIVAVNAVSANFARVFTGATAPANTSQVTFTIRIQPSNAGGGSQVDFDDVQGTINSLPVILDAGATGGVQSPGDIAMISTRLHNVSANTVNGVELVATPSGGLSVHQEQALLDANRVDQREGSVIFNLGNLDSGQDSLFAFAVLLSSGIVPGKRYEITLFARTVAGVPLSDIVRVVIDVEPDPLFHLGTIIGKVFNDLNGNAMQDPGERGIPNVRIGTEQGVIVHTDAHGKYHIPALSPGRHVVKADVHSLARGTQFVTEESYLAKITEGLLAKVNFAVKLPADDIPQEFQGHLTANVVQELDRIKPELSVEMDPAIVRTGKGMLERDVRFRLHTNYSNLIKEWRIEIRDEMGEELWAGIGRGAPPPEVRWDGHDNAGNLVEPGDYSFRLIVADPHEKEDWTPLGFFRVLSKLEPQKNSSETKPLAPLGFFNLMSDGKRSIPLAGRTAVRIQGETPSRNQLLVNRQPVSVGTDGRFETAMFLPDGVHKIEVTTTTEEGESLSVRKEVELKENYLFMVGLGEEELGNNKFKGNIESVQTEDRFRDGFYEDGRIAYYLKGKVKGKFLVTSSYDSEDDNKRTKLFTNLDPDKYYPVYGDASQIDYSATDSQDKFFILIEKDKSFLEWGAMNTDFTDTELATHQRTMTGGKVHFETLNTTRYGDPKFGFSGFHSEQKQLADRNEFQGTGGSLFYLRKRRVVEGSEKVRVEVRDKLTDVILSRRDLLGGQDYEIDYDQGRIILSKPLSSVVTADTIINQGILEGNKNVLVVDFEYMEPVVLGYGTSGIRGFQHLSDFVRVGGTYIEDKHPPNNRNYTLRGVDAEVKVGLNTKLTAEYAESENPQLGGFSSTNGGLTFLGLGSVGEAAPEQGRNGAYVIRLQTRPLKRFDFSAYVQKYNPFFSNADTVFSQSDMKKYGLEANYRVTNNFSLRYRQDRLHAIKKNLFSSAEIDRGALQTVQANYDGQKLLAMAEYRHSNIILPQDRRLSPSLFSVNDFDDAVGTKVGYHVSERWTPYVRGQATLNDSDNSNNQLGVGLESKVSDKAVVTIEENFGNIGDSTQLRFETKTSNATSAYASIAMGNERDYGRGIQTTLGSSHLLDDRSRLFSEKEYSLYRGDNHQRNILGYDRSFFDNRLGSTLTIERNELDRSRESGVVFAGTPILNNAFSAALSYNDSEFLEASSKFEVRRFSESASSERQWLSYNNLGIQLNKDLEFFARFNLSRTRDLDLESSLADFAELNLGFSFRPVDWDRFHALTRYSLLSDNLPDDRFAGNIALEDLSHIIAVEGSYDFNRYLGLVEKFAFKLTDLDTSFGGGLEVFNYLWINRINFHVTRKWDLGLEYRILTQQGAGENLRHGILVEVDRELFDYTRIGVGYNFTDFDDDLRPNNSYQSFNQGPFVRLTGKF